MSAIQKNKELLSVEKAREKYNIETCEYTRQKLKKFILTQCNLLEQSGVNCLDLYIDLQDGFHSSANQKSKKIVIELSEFDRLVKSDKKLLDLTRKHNNLVLRVEKTRTDKELEEKIKNQKATLARLMGKPVKPPPILIPENERNAYETAKRVRDEYAAELVFYKKGFNELKNLALEKNTPEILMIIQKCYAEIDCSRIQERAKTQVI